LGLPSYYDDNSLCNTERISFQSSLFNPKSHNRIHVFPNPTTGKVVVTFPQKKVDEILYIEVTDVAGKVVLKENYSEKLCRFDLNTFNPGTYFLKVYGQTFFGTSIIILQR